MQSNVENVCQQIFGDLMASFPDVERVILSEATTGQLLFLLENVANKAVIKAKESGEDTENACTDFPQMATTTAQQLGKLSFSGQCKSITAIYENYAALQVHESGIFATIIISRVDGSSPLGLLQQHVPTLLASAPFKEVCAATKKIIESY
eukprot:PhF_6_TR7582/c0_g1_i1/m.11157